MTIERVRQLIGEYTNPEIMLDVSADLLNLPEGNAIYNEMIRNNVPPNLHGIYVWLNPTTATIVYFGMAGKIKTDGTFGTHALQNRLTASRGKENGVDIPTSAYLRNYMNTSHVEELSFHIFPTVANMPPSYVESILLYNYFLENHCLPELNNAF